jgi:hypothetical protein
VTFSDFSGDTPFHENALFPAGHHIDETPTCGKLLRNCLTPANPEVQGSTMPSALLSVSRLFFFSFECFLHPERFRCMGMSEGKEFQRVRD